MTKHCALSLEVLVSTTICGFLFSFLRSTFLKTSPLRSQNPSASRTQLPYKMTQNRRNANRRLVNKKRAHSFSRSSTASPRTPKLEPPHPADALLRGPREFSNDPVSPPLGAAREQQQAQQARAAKKDAAAKKRLQKKKQAQQQQGDSSSSSSSDTEESSTGSFTQLSAPEKKKKASGKPAAAANKAAAAPKAAAAKKAKAAAPAAAPKAKAAAAAPKAAAPKRARKAKASVDIDPHTLKTALSSPLRCSAAVRRDLHSLRDAPTTPIGQEVAHQRRAHRLGLATAASISRYGVGALRNKTMSIIIAATDKIAVDPTFKKKPDNVVVLPCRVVNVDVTPSGTLVAVVRSVPRDGESDGVKFAFTNRVAIAADYGRILVEDVDDSVAPPGFTEEDSDNDDNNNDNNNANENDNPPASWSSSSSDEDEEEQE
jgi:hypothetical protein